MHLFDLVSRRYFCWSGGERTEFRQVQRPIFSIVGLLVLYSPIFSVYKRMKEGKAAYPTLELDEANGKVAVLHKDVTVIVDLSQIKNLRLQRRSG